MTIACDGKLIEKIIAGLDKVSTFIAVLGVNRVVGRMVVWRPGKQLRFGEQRDEHFHPSQNCKKRLKRKYS
jgi:hypothetical protein